MRASNRWFIGYINPKGRVDDLSLSSEQPGMVIIDATSKYSALKQARAYLKKGSIITGIGYVDAEGVSHEDGEFRIRGC